MALCITDPQDNRDCWKTASSQYMESKSTMLAAIPNRNGDSSPRQEIMQQSPTACSNLEQNF